jgi:hypothetical protein
MGWRHSSRGRPLPSESKALSSNPILRMKGREEGRKEEREGGREEGRIEGRR